MSQTMGFAGQPSGPGAEARLIGTYRTARCPFARSLPLAPDSPRQSKAARRIDALCINNKLRSPRSLVSKLLLPVRMSFKRVVSMLPIFERSRAAILLSFLVFLAAPAWGAVAFVQKVPNTTTATHFSGTSAQTMAITPTAGNLLVVVVTVAGSTNPTNTVTVADSDSVSYTAAGNATTSGGLGRVSIFYRPNVTSGAKTITITPSATPASPVWAVEVMEYVGVDTTPTVTTASAIGSSTAPTVSVTPTAGASLYIAATGSGNATVTSYTSGAGWTQRYSDPSNSPNPPNASEEITSATGAQTATWTLGTSQSWVAVIASFSTPSSGGIAWIQGVNKSVGGAVAYVQSKSLTSGGSGATNTIAAPALNAVTSGNAVVGFVSWGSDTTSILTSVTDDKGNTYTIVQRAGSTNSGTQSFASFYLLNITNAPTIITANFSSSQTYRTIIVHEVSGLSALDQSAINVPASLPGTGTDALTSGSVTTTANGEYIVAGVYNPDTDRNLPMYAAGTGYTKREEVGSGTSDFENMASEDQIQATAGSIAGTFTDATFNEYYGVALMTFKTAGSNTSITSPALPQPILAGDLIVVSIRAPTGTWTVTDNQGQTYSIAGVVTNNVGIYYFANSTAVPANTLTVTVTTTGAAGTMRIFVDVFRGAATSNVLDTTGTINAEPTTPSGCTVINTKAPDSAPSAGNGELVFAAAGMTNQSTYTACTTNGVAMTIGGQNNTSPNGSMFTSYALASLAGAQNVAISEGTGCSGCLNGGVAIFRPVCAYNFRKSITVGAGQVISGPLTNFPLLVNVTDANLKTTANGGNVTDAGGDDIIFRASDGVTQLDHEIERYTATTGEMVAWVRVPSIDVGTVIYMYYGNSCVTQPTQNPTGVWDANFKGVWHLTEATAANRLDSTSNANTLTPSASNPTQVVAGKIAGSANFAGASIQYLTATAPPVAVDAAASASISSGSSLSWTHTASGTNRLVIVGVSWSCDSFTAGACPASPGGVPPTISSITYGGTAMTPIGSKNVADQEIAQYQLVNPPTGAQTVSVTFSSNVSRPIYGGSVSFTNVNQTTPIGTFASASGNSSSPSVTVASAVGEIVIDTLDFDTSAATLTVGAGQTQRWKNVFSAMPWGAGSTEAGAASVTMSWTANVADNWAIGAVSVKPAAGSSLILGTQYTLEAWVNGSDITTNKSILNKNSIAPNNSYRLRFSSDRPTNIISFDGSTAINLNQSGTSVAGTWYHVVGVYNNPTLYLYLNGVLNNSLATTGGATFASNASFQIGAYDSGTQPFNGIIDEARVSNVARSAGWIQTEFNNESAPGTFVAVGSQEGPGALNAYESATYKGAISGFLNTKIAGTTTANLDIIALTTTTPKTIDTSTTWSARTVKVEVLDASNNTGALDANNCRSTWVSLNSVNKTFPSCSSPNCGRTTISLAMPANSYPNARLRISYPTSSPTSIGCSTDNFAIRPSTFSLAITDTDWQTTGTPGARALNLLAFSATPIHKAGRPFSVRATAQTSGGATTTNYTGGPTPTPTSCVGAACTTSFGTLTLGTSFASGALAADTATYNNVGSFALQLIDTSFSSVDAVPGDTPPNCAGQYACGVTVNVGRFVPDHFAVSSYNTPVFGSACGSFTYIGQAFNYVTAPVITVTAQDFANNTTTLYNTTGSWFRITNASLTGKAYSAATGTMDVSGLPGTDPVIASSGLGVGTLTFGSGTGLLFTRSTPAQFDADISLAINVIDADGVTYASNPARFSTATLGNGIAFNNGKPMRFGQLALGNALGSEVLDLPIPIYTQYWNGTSFVTNTLDSCTTITASNIALSNYQGSITSGNLGISHISISGAFNAGIGTLKLTKPSPTPTTNGSVDLCVDLGGDATCVATPAGMSYLQGVWSGTTYTLDPRARAAFGFGKGSYSGGGLDPFVYQRENY